METTIFNLANCPACNTKLMLHSYNYLDNDHEKFKYLICNNCNISFATRYFSEELGNIDTLKDKINGKYYILFNIKINGTSKYIFYLDNYRSYEFRINDYYNVIDSNEFEHYEINNENYLLICNYICKMLKNIIFV